MIWYLLYPFRRTSDPVALRDDHCFRRAASRLGLAIARHSLFTIIAAIGVSLSLPALFLCSSTYHPKLPDHVWASAESFANSESAIPDISVKQAWVFGDWMRALERETLLEAAAVQDWLLGPMSNCDTDVSIATPASTDPSAPGPSQPLSFLHSPLLYWNCSVAAIESDYSILATINGQAHKVSRGNVTLKPSSVLAGMLWSYQRLVAADALVISLFYKAGSRAGKLWDERAYEVAQYDTSRWDIIPISDGSTGSRLFRLQSEPLSFQDEAIFLGAYGLVVLYVVFSLRGMRMLKSRVGLFMTVVVQGFLSILTALTIAAFLRIDISNIPLEAYPVIVLVIGQENMSRLMNEVEKIPPQTKSDARVATALGAVAHLSLISAAQNMFTLWLLSRTVSPGLASFCGFAAISLAVDLVFFFTFFVAILSVDLRRYELEDYFKEEREQYEIESTKVPINQISQPQRRNSKQDSHFALPYPRVLGTIFIISFLFTLSRHFLDGKTAFYRGRKFASQLDQGQFAMIRDHENSINTIIHQTGGLVDWLKVQDHQTTRETLHATSSQSYSILVRAYDPLVIVQKHASRDFSLREPLLASSISSMGSRSIWMIVAFLCALVAPIIALRKYSFNGERDKTANRVLESRTLSSAQCLPRGHSLDVFILCASSNRILISVGFDHGIRVWNLDSRVMTSHFVPISQKRNLWPVVAVAVDGKTEWLGIYSKLGEVNFWHIQQRRFGRSITPNLEAHVVACFFTTSTSHGGYPVTRLLLVNINGRLADIEVESGNVTFHQICTDRVQSSTTSSYKRMPLRVITTSEDNKIYISARRDNYWTTQNLEFSIPTLSVPSRLHLTVVPGLSMIGLAFNLNTSQLHLTDLLSGATIYTFRPRRFEHRTLRAIHSLPQQCLYCGAMALMSFSIAYTEGQDGFTMVTVSAEQNPRLRTGLICLRAERDSRERRCIGFEGGTEKTYSMQHAGVWEATGANGVAGVRRKMQPQKTSEAYSRYGSLSRRKVELAPKSQKKDEEAWEAWTMTATGSINIHPLQVGLFTDRIGPMCAIGRNAIGVGLAEDIILVQFGDQLRDDDDADSIMVRKAPRTRLAGRPKFCHVGRSRA